MPRRPRRALSSPYVHVINRSVRKESVFLRPPDYRAFLQALGEGLARYPVGLLSYCIMPNHWHLVLGPASPDSLAHLMRWVTGTHAIRWHVHRGTRGQGPVYQGRFHARPIESSAELVRVCRYVERNALRAGLVERAQDWPWGSLSERLRRHSHLPLTSTPFLTSRAWIDHVNAPATARELLLTPTSGTKTVKTVENTSVPMYAVHT